MAVVVESEEEGWMCPPRDSDHVRCDSSKRSPRCLDLFCGGGGATKGLQCAGFHVTGVDIEPQPHYCGEEFVQADAMTFPLDGYDCYWASPPCQRFSRLASVHNLTEYANLISPIRERLKPTNKPYIIENVPGAPLLDPVLLCGGMFGLGVYRHRIFETNVPVLRPIHIKHIGRIGDGYHVHNTGHSAWNNGSLKQRQLAMGIDWISELGPLAQAIPPAYSEFLGKYMWKCSAMTTAALRYAPKDRTE